MSRYRVSVYDGSQHPAHHAYKTNEVRDLRAARKEAARMLGYSSLRGASTWERWQGGTVYQFGPRTEDNGYDFAVIEEIAQ